MPDIRKAVLAEMKRQKMSRYALIQLLKGKGDNGGNVPDATVYEFLRGASAINSNYLGLIFDALGLEMKRKK